MKIYAKNIIFAIALWLILPLVVHFPRFLIQGTVFPALCEWFPDVFVNYSPVLEPDSYAVLSAVLDILVASATLMIFTYITVRYDNERMEYMISETDGFYTFSEGAALYYKRYALSDLAVALAVPLPFIIAAHFVPTHIHDYVDPVFNYLFSFGKLFTSHLGEILGGAALVLTIFLLRLLAGMKSIRVWQGIWLSEIE